MARAGADVSLRTELWAGPDEREVDIEENGAKSQAGCPDSNWGPLDPNGARYQAAPHPERQPTLAKAVETREALGEHDDERSRRAARRR